MIDKEVIWAAGFFDGEGCAFVRRSDAKGEWLHAGLRISQVNREPLERFAAAVRGGQITPCNNGDGAKQQYQWQARSAKEVRRITALLMPHLCAPKREQIERALRDERRARPVPV